MLSLPQFLLRSWRAFSPKEIPKKDGAIRFGLLGASNIAPMALIGPARTHPEVIIVAIAARDENRATEYARKYGIPVVHKSYQDILDDSSIDAIYIPLPNSYHYEWALRSLRAGKHVLLEKPSTSNATEAERLFRSELCNGPSAPVLLEAFHYRFHPAWHTFLSFITPQLIESAEVVQWLSRGMIKEGDIRFQFALSGGALMDFGTYGVSVLRGVFGRQPEECVDATYRPMPDGKEPHIDQALCATLKFPGGATGKLDVDLSAQGGWPMTWLTGRWPRLKLPKVTVKMRERECDSIERGKLTAKKVSLIDGEKVFFKRKVVMWNYLIPTLYHSICVEDTYIVRGQQGQEERTWTEIKQVKAYTWPEKSGWEVGEDWWLSYRYQLEEFVNRVKGRPGSRTWVDGEDSIGQMEVIDMIYQRMGLPLRPTSEYE